MVRELKISETSHKRSVPQECGLQDQLYNYIDAASRNQSCYIAATFKSTEIGEDGRDIDVGDGRVKGGYYNAPLQENRGYGIILGAQGHLEVSYISLYNMKPMSGNGLSNLNQLSDNAYKLAHVNGNEIMRVGLCFIMGYCSHIVWVL